MNQIHAQISYWYLNIVHENSLVVQACMYQHTTA